MHAGNAAASRGGPGPLGRLHPRRRVLTVLRLRFRYRRRPTAELAVALVAFVSALAVATIVVTNGESPSRGPTGEASDGWSVQSSGTSDELADLHFVDSGRGWTVGAKGVILRTADGGETWDRLESGTSFDLAAVTFVSPREGWIAGQFGLILHTVDGGDTWEGQADPEVTLRLNLVDIHFANALNGVAFTEQGSVMLRTGDGGRTWERGFVSYTQSRSRVFFLDAERGWAAQKSGGVLQTVDGGETWRLNAGANGVTVGTSGIFFLNEDLGWISGWRGKGTGPEFLRFLTDGMVARTLDGGATWTRHDSRTGKFLQDVEFVDAMEGWAVGSFGTVLHSDDGGVTWTAVQSGVEDTLLSVDFPDRDNGWAIGENGVVLRYTRP